jgi:RES domain-containing protein
MTHRNTGRWNAESAPAVYKRSAERCSIVGLCNAAGQVLDTGAAASTERLIT